MSKKITRSHGHIAVCLVFAGWLAVFAQAAESDSVKNSNGTAAPSVKEDREFALKQKEFELHQEEFELKKEESKQKHVEHWFTILGFFGTAAALIFGLLQYYKGEQWKRAEFAAKEMKDFFADPVIQNVLTMIDWSPRSVNLFLVKDLPLEKYQTISRITQSLALLPHTLLSKDGSSDAEAVRPDAEAARPDPAEEQNEDLSTWQHKKSYSSKEAKIRDSYDRFLDGLDRFGNYLKYGLLKKDGLDPYLAYWVGDISSFIAKDDEITWTSVLLSYIHVYGFAGVQSLFKDYGKDISPDGEIFKKQLSKMHDQHLAGKLVEACRNSDREGGSRANRELEER